MKDSRFLLLLACGLLFVGIVACIFYGKSQQRNTTSLGLNDGIPVEEFDCPVAGEYLKVSLSSIDPVIFIVKFSKNGGPIPSRVYVNNDTNSIKVYHDDQYDPSTQKENIPALYECTYLDKNLFETFNIPPAQFEGQVK